MDRLLNEAQEEDAELERTPMADELNEMKYSKDYVDKLIHSLTAKYENSPEYKLAKAIKECMDSMIWQHRLDQESTYD